MKPKPWKTLGSEKTYEIDPWITVHKDTVELPSGRVIDDYYRFNLPSYAMIYPLRDDGKVLCVRQYKHALKTVALALPTGCLEKNEEPENSAKRELLEETGYASNEWSFLGSYLVDGNKGCGKAYFYIAKNVIFSKPPIDDDSEITEVVFIEPQNLINDVIKGKLPLLSTTALIALVSISNSNL